MAEADRDQHEAACAVTVSRDRDDLGAEAALAALGHMGEPAMADHEPLLR